MSISISEALRKRATAEGFDAVRITSASLDHQAGDRLAAFVNQGRHGDMGWMKDTLERRRSPVALWPEAKSAVMCGLSYAQGLDAMARLERRDEGVISVYALNRDYHDIIKGKLKRLAQWFAHRAKAEVKVFVDTAPLMEKPLAQQSGLGWQGKHTNLVSRELGSWFFIGSLLTTAELDTDEPEGDHCGSCRACLDICPTKAFPAPYQLDARLCISYLTIEHQGMIDRELRPALGNRIYGCDDCLAVCPWNKFASDAREAKLLHRDELLAPRLADLAKLDDAGFRSLFSGSPVKRLGRDRFVRNVLVAIGNSGEAGLLDCVEPLLRDASPLVRAMAVWALGRLAKADIFMTTRQTHMPGESDDQVVAEWMAV